MKETLYDLTAQAKQLMEMEDLPDEVLKDTLESLGIDDKIGSTVPVIKQMKAESTMLADEVKKLQEKKKVADNKAQRLTDYVTNCMGELDMKKAGNGLHNISIGKPSTVVSIAEGTTVPEKYQKVKVDADKTALKEALLGGEVIDGITLEDGKASVRIK